MDNYGPPNWNFRNNQNAMMNTTGDNYIDTSVKNHWWKQNRLPKNKRKRLLNMKLAKILQPKNATMVLHEVVNDPKFTFMEHDDGTTKYCKAVVTVEGLEHIGTGATRAIARNEAAEAALKYWFQVNKLDEYFISLNRGLNNKEMETDNNEVSEETTIEETQTPIQQIASFALYKLLDMWSTDKLKVNNENNIPLKPAKKLPANAASLDPLMIFNQSYPSIRFEQLPSDGSFKFNVKCVVDGNIFEGSGNSLRIAKREAAYLICKTMLGVQYDETENLENTYECQ